MKKLGALAILLIITSIAFTTAYAQSKEDKQRDKQLKKEWKKKAKSYSKDPLALKSYEESMSKKLDEANRTVDELTERNATLGARADSISIALKKAKDETTKVQKQFDELLRAFEAQKEVNEKGITPGLIFKVQIGAFVNFDINTYLKETENFEGESADKFNKYTIGNFRDMNVAEAFKKDIAKMGIKDAWIVPYYDGTRITMEEAKKIADKGGKIQDFFDKDASKKKGKKSEDEGTYESKEEESNSKPKKSK